MKKSSGTALLFTLLIFVPLLLISGYVRAGDPGMRRAGGSSYYQKHGEGWFWYQDPPEEPEAPDEEPLPPLPEPPAVSGTSVIPPPEYSADGGHIWFCSVRSGLMQAWRMRPDGSEQTQMTEDPDFNLWFPHISPDGRLVTLLAYRKEDLKPHEHLPHKRVELRLMDSDGDKMKTLARFFGGQGTINVNSWSPDSRRFAYVRYGIRGLTEKELEAITE